MLGDGMADLPIAALGKKTPLEAANKPCMDMLASKGVNGNVDTVPEGMVPESDTANLAVMGYDPRVLLSFYKNLHFLGIRINGMMQYVAVFGFLHLTRCVCC